jgi:hypothetical protein
MTLEISADEQSSGSNEASRSVDVYFDNQTDIMLTRRTFGLAHGIWTNDKVPPEQIAGQTKAYWRSESDGFMTGTEGFAEYYPGVDLESIVRVIWDNPWLGSNKYTESAPSGYKISHSGGSGDNATVTFTMKKS